MWGLETVSWQGPVYLGVVLYLKIKRMCEITMGMRQNADI